jgi:hypothetical protein
LAKDREKEIFDSVEVENRIQKKEFSDLQKKYINANTNSIIYKNKTAKTIYQLRVDTVFTEVEKQDLANDFNSFADATDLRDSISQLQVATLNQIINGKDIQLAAKDTLINVQGKAIDTLAYANGVLKDNNQKLSNEIIKHKKGKKRAFGLGVAVGAAAEKGIEVLLKK